MKKLLISAALCLAAATAATAQQPVGTLYFDFGSITASQGTITSGADSNGNYWNNITNNTDGNKYAASGSVYSQLVYSDNTPSGAGLTLSSRFSTNGKSGGGGLLTPSGDLIGDLAIATATEDYFFIESSENNSKFVISGLNPDHAFRFHVFASRKATDNRIGTYTMEGLNRFSGNLQLAGTGIGAGGENQNTQNILVSDPVFPDADGNIEFTVSRNTGAYIALNCMKVEELSGVEKPVVETTLSLTLTGEGTETGSPLPMKMITPAGKPTQVFECYTMLRPGGVFFQGVTDKGNTNLYGVVDGKLVKDAADSPLTVAADQLSFVRIDFSTGELKVVPVTSMSLVGSVCPGGWSNTAGEEIPYIGNGVWKGTVGLTKVSGLNDRERFVFIMNKSWDYQLRRPKGTERGVGLNSDGWDSDDININHGTYTVTLDLNDFVYYIESPSGIDEYRISVMGSSVANGQGATDNQGYAYMYGQLLQERYASEQSPNPFYTSGISINGNSTVNLLARYNDLIHDFGRYVIFGVSLGNEGIHGASDQEAVLNQFATNMQTLISRAREDGKVPVVMNNYTRGDFNASDYEYVRRMNLLLDSWDVPVINLLGAIDNGAGNWADTYQNGDDIYHPNTDGHREFFHAIPPSLFDALKMGVALPEREAGNTLRLSETGKVEFTPEGTVHPFTLVVNLRDLPQSGFTTIATPAGDATLSVANGAIVYTSPSGANISYALPASASTMADTSVGNTTSVALTHYYAQGNTRLYVNGNLAGSVAEKLQPTSVKIAPQAGRLALSEVMFYRSAMNSDEVGALNDGRMLRSSMEVYLPFSNSDNAAENKAQSMTEATIEGQVTSGVEDVAGDVCLPFSAAGGSGELTVTASEPLRLMVCGVDGRMVCDKAVSAGVTTIAAAPGVYVANGVKVIVR